jgi:uracil-DNA glycosylase
MPTLINKPKAKSALPPEIDPKKVKIILICEALPENSGDYFYSGGRSLYVTNTIEAFNNAGLKVKDMEDVTRLGVFLTVAVKEPRRGLTVPADRIDRHSYALEKELGLFPNLKAILLMGDAAIKALNYISRRATGKRVIPPGSTYKIRNGNFYFNGIRVFPSYLQTGRNFLIEKSKQRMVDEDIRNAFKLLQG